MRAIVIARFGGPEVLELVERPAPEPRAGEVRVRVRATAVNRADLLQRMGRYPAPADAPQDIPGIEFAGEVDGIGAGGEGAARLGDRVFGLVGGGSYAEFITVPAATLARIPDGVSYVEAAAVPEAFITAYDAMVTQDGLAAGETVLVSAVASGVGTAAVQLARVLGARTIGTSRTEDKLARCKALGLDHGIVVDAGGGAGRGLDFAAAVNALTEGNGADVIVELVGGDYVAEDLACIASRGRIVVVGLLAGATASLDLAILLRKRASLRGTVLRSRSADEKIAVARTFAQDVVPLLAAGRVKAVVDRVMKLEDAAAAHTYVASNEGLGKVVLEVS